MKILLADDSKSITNMIVKYIQIKAPEDEIFVADNGALALDLYAKFKPDVVILDLAMPVMDGIETLTRILKMNKDASVFIMSATDSEWRVEQCLQKGALAFIEKPFSPAKLIDFIKNIQYANTDKKMASVFWAIASKLENIIDKIITNYIPIKEKLTNVVLALPNTNKIITNHAHVTLKDVVAIPMTHSQVPHFTHNMTIRVVPDIEKSLQIDIPADCVGFTTDVTGQSNGIVVSVINKNDLQQILRKNGFVVDNDMIMEFFNIVNNKIIDSISNLTHMRIISSPVRSYNKDTDSILYDIDLTKVVFDISWEEKTTSLMIYLYLNVFFLGGGRVDAHY